MEKPGPLGTKRVLVADDERHVARLLQEELLRQGYEVTAVHDGRAALEALETTSYSYAILDLMMPLKDGLEVLTWIRTHDKTKGMWVALMTAQADALSRAEWRYKPDLWVRKPLSSADVFDLP